MPVFPDLTRWLGTAALKSYHIEKRKGRFFCVSALLWRCYWQKQADGNNNTRETAGQRIYYNKLKVIGARLVDDSEHQFCSTLTVAISIL